MCYFVSYRKYLGFFCLFLNLRLICQLEFQWTLWYCYLLQYLLGLRHRKDSEVGSRNWSELYCFLQPCQRLKFLQTIFYYIKISSFEGIIKGFLVKEVAIEGTQRNLSRHRMLLSSNFLSSLFLRTFPEKVSDPSAVYNRQSICLQLTEHCAQPTEYMFATVRSVMHCAQPTE